MRKILFVLILLVLILSVGCKSTPQKYMLSEEEQEHEKAKERTQLANPATLHCMNTTGAAWTARQSAGGSRR